MDQVTELIKKFKKFSENEIGSAIKELGGIGTEKNRKHLQRLVYANLVNRFDALIDNLLLIFATSSSHNFQDVVLNKVKDSQVSSKDFYEIFLSEKPRELVIARVEDLVRLNFLRDRHSKKLRTLLQDCLQVSSGDLDRPRVNANDGRIHETYSRRHKQVPTSIIGYADYLYCKRNVLTHGDGDSLSILSSDADYLRKSFHIIPAKYVGIKLSSIQSAATFYLRLCSFIETGKWPDKRGW